MATEKNISSRIINKHDTEVNWNKATNFIPKAGEIIIYDKDETYDFERIKIGDNVTSVINLPFYLENQISTKQNKITGTAGQFVVIGDDGNLTTKTIPLAEEATFGALINFTIEDTLYQAEEGMTWAEWIETTYNIDEYRNSDNNICSNNSP